MDFRAAPLGALGSLQAGMCQSACPHHQNFPMPTCPARLPQAVRGGPPKTEETPRTPLSGSLPRWRQLFPSGLFQSVGLTSALQRPLPHLGPARKTSPGDTGQGGDFLDPAGPPSAHPLPRWM